MCFVPPSEFVVQIGRSHSALLLALLFAFFSYGMLRVRGWLLFHMREHEKPVEKALSD